MLARLLLMTVGSFSLLLGLDAALLRMGQAAPLSKATLADSLGVLMVYGFFGTVITLTLLRRSNALGFLVLLLEAAATGGIIVNAITPLGVPMLLPALLWGASLVIMLGSYSTEWSAHPSAALVLKGLGALTALGGILLWGRGFTVPLLIPWWTLFLVFSLLGIRLESAPPGFLGNSTRRRLLVNALCILVSLPLTLTAPSAGYALLGVSLFALLLELAVIETKSISTIPRFDSICSIFAYFWGGVAATVWIIYGPTFAGGSYDVVIHSLTLGFATTLIMRLILTHIPLPTVFLWVFLALLEVGLGIRFISVARGATSWVYGGVMNVLTFFVLFMVVLIFGALVTQKSNKSKKVKA